MSILVGGGVPQPEPIQIIGPVDTFGNPILDPGYQDVDPAILDLIPKASELAAIAGLVAVSPVSPDLLNSVLKEIDMASRKGSRSVSVTMSSAAAASLSDAFNGTGKYTASATVDYSHGAISSTSVLTVSF